MLRPASVVVALGMLATVEGCGGEGTASDATETDASPGSSDAGGSGDVSSGDDSAGACVHEPHVPPGAIAFYDFEGQGPVVTDVTGNGHDGTFEGATATRGPGKFCTGLASEGDDAVVVPDSDAFDFVDGYTIEMWVLLPEPDSSPRVHKGSTFTLRASHGELSYVAHQPCFSGGGTHPEGFDPARWYHVAGTWDGMEWRYFVDAVQIHEVQCTSPPLLNEIPVRMGQGIGASVMDDVALFDHARSSEQICADARGSWNGTSCDLP